MPSPNRCPRATLNACARCVQGRQAGARWRSRPGLSSRQIYTGQPGEGESALPLLSRIITAQPAPPASHRHRPLQVKTRHQRLSIRCETLRDELERFLHGGAGRTGAAAVGWLVAGGGGTRAQAVLVQPGRPRSRDATCLCFQATRTRPYYVALPPPHTHPTHPTHTHTPHTHPQMTMIWSRCACLDERSWRSSTERWVWGSRVLVCSACVRRGACPAALARLPTCPCMHCQCACLSALATPDVPSRCADARAAGGACSCGGGAAARRRGGTAASEHAAARRQPPHARAAGSPLAQPLGGGGGGSAGGGREPHAGACPRGCHAQPHAAAR